MVAYLGALRQYAQGPTARNVAIVAEYTKISPDLIRKGDWFPMYPDGRVNINAIRRFQDWLYAQEFIGVRMPVNALVDTAFLVYAAEALTSRGVPKEVRRCARCAGHPGFPWSVLSSSV